MKARCFFAFIQENVIKNVNCVGVNASESVKVHKSTSLIFAIMWIDVEVCMHYN